MVLVAASPPLRRTSSTSTRPSSSCGVGGFQAAVSTSIKRPLKDLYPACNIMLMIPFWNSFYRSLLTALIVLIALLFLPSPVRAWVYFTTEETGEIVHWESGGLCTIAFKYHPYGLDSLFGVLTRVARGDLFLRSAKGLGHAEASVSNIEGKPRVFVTNYGCTKLRIQYAMPHHVVGRLLGEQVDQVRVPEVLGAGHFAALEVGIEVYGAGPGCQQVADRIGFVGRGWGEEARIVGIVPWPKLYIDSTRLCSIR